VWEEQGARLHAQIEYMEKENKRSRDKYLKKERARIIKLVELAYKGDPRIRR
jgi:hypothetical protein